MSSNWKTVRVFISSTFRDMHAERDHLVRFVFPQLRQELLQWRIHLVDVDLRWGVTSDQDASEVCREVVDECHPRFLCMLGGRYGWVPDGKPRSITADEVHYGVLDREATQRGFAHFYFREESSTAAMEETTLGEFREPQGSDSQKALTKLKQAIADAGLNPFTYPAHWDKQSRRLIGLAKFGQQVHDDLLRSMKDDPELRDRFTESTEKPDEFTEENAAMEAFIEERTQRFVLGSRKTVMDELLAHANSTGGNGYLCLVGTPGSGKSALLAQFSRSFSDSSLIAQSSSLLINHFVGASAGSTDVRRTLRRLCHELIDGAGITAEIPEDPEKLRATFPEILKQASEKKHVVILLDAVNQFDSTTQLDGLMWLPEELTANVRIILSAMSEVCGQRPADDPRSSVVSPLDALRHRRIPPREIALEPLTAEDTQAIITEFLHRYRKSMTDDQRAALLAKADAGTPLYLLVALEELRTLGVSRQIADSRDQERAVLELIAQLPPDTRGLFIWILKRLEDDDGFRNSSGQIIGSKLVSKFASLLGVSRHGLSQQELVELLSPSDAKASPPIEPDPQGNVAALIQLLRPYLMQRGELLDFYHGQFREAAATSYLSSPAADHDARRDLARYFDGQTNHVASDSATVPANPRKLVELPWQRLQMVRVSQEGNLWAELGRAMDDLIRLFTDLSFLESKTQAGLAFELFSEFTATVQAARRRGRPDTPALDLIDRIMRSHGQRIASFPESLLGIIQGSLCNDAPSNDWSVQHLVSKWEKAKVSPWLKTIYRSQRACAQLLESRLSAPSGVQSLWFAAPENLLMAVDSEGGRTAWNLADQSPISVIGPVGAGKAEFWLVGYSNPVSFRKDGCEAGWKHTNHPDSAFEIQVLEQQGAISPGRFLAVVDLRTKQLLASWRPHGDEIGVLTFLGNPHRFATTARGEIAVWDISSLAYEGAAATNSSFPVSGHGNEVKGIDLDPCGERCISIGLGGDCLVWNIKGKHVAQQVRLHELYSGYLSYVCFLPDHRTALVVHDDICAPQGYYLVDTDTGQSRPLRFEIAHPPVRMFSRNPPVTADRFKIVAVAKETGRVLWRNCQPPFYITETNLTEVTSDGTSAADSCSRYMPENPVSLRGAMQIGDLLCLSCCGQMLLRFDPLTWQVFVKSGDSIADELGLLWKGATTLLEWTFDGLGEVNWLSEEQPSKRIAWSQNASMSIAADNHTGTVAFINLGCPEPRIRHVEAHAGETIACAIRADGRIGVTVGRDRKLTLWDCADARALATLPLDFVPSCCAISADGRVIAVGMHGGEVLFLSPQCVPDCVVPTRTELLQNERAVLTRFRVRMPEGVTELTDFDLLLSLATSTALQPPLRTAARERITECVGNRYWEDETLRRATRFVEELAHSDAEATVRVAATNALSDLVSLDKLASDANAEVAGAATIRKRLLAETIWFVRVRSVDLTECLELVNLLKGCCGEDVKMCSAGGKYYNGKSMIEVVFSVEPAGKRVGFVIDPRDEATCLRALATLDWLVRASR
ncbi:MAG: DUF4062 domain-containing protein [Pontiellaceae bacterium]|jgi:WD40 repeat protein/phosphotransferase system HPr-like phosphotransfer protein|nr:DUF4062 domain-containing protein [Pontiellaceae bacterium]